MYSHEKDLLMELEGLKYILELFQGIDGLLEKAVEEYGEYFDPMTTMAIESLRYDVQVIMEGKIIFDNRTINGLVKQFADVLDEVQTLQCGLQTKKGVDNEDVKEGEEE